MGGILKQGRFLIAAFCAASPRPPGPAGTAVTEIINYLSSKFVIRSCQCLVAVTSASAAAHGLIGAVPACDAQRRNQRGRSSVGFTALSSGCGEGKAHGFCGHLEGRVLLTKTLRCQSMVHSIQLVCYFLISLITPKQFALSPPLS